MANLEARISEIMNAVRNEIHQMVSSELDMLDHVQVMNRLTNIVRHFFKRGDTLEVKQQIVERVEQMVTEEDLWRSALILNGNLQLGLP